MHTVLYWILGIALYFISGTLTLTICKTISDGELNNETKPQTVLFFIWPLVVAFGLVFGMYFIFSQFKYLNPLYLSDKFSDMFKPTVNVWRYKWSQRGLKVKNDLND